MAKTKAAGQFDDSFYQKLVEQAVPAPRTASSRNDVHVPKVIADQVQRHADNRQAFHVPVTNEDEFEHVRDLYISAAYQLGHSANVKKHTDKDSGAWLSTRVSIGAKRGRASSNGTAAASDNESTSDDVQAAAHSVSENRGW
jgi:hypothetical protein